MNAPLLLDTVLIDWLTVTSFDEQFLNHWDGKLRQIGSGRREAKTLQYEGTWWDIEGGRAFIGSAIQKGVLHHMLRLTGYAAENYKEGVFSQIRQGFATVTRIDLQCTREVSERWSQWDMLVRLKQRKKMVGWIESKTQGRGYETVYIGSRNSERMTRVYIKSADSPRLLRMETEYKGGRAAKIGRMLARGDRAGDFLAYELEKTIGDKNGLTKLFLPALSGFNATSPRVVPDRSIEKTSGWLLSSALPAFIRVINSHESDGRVMDAFGEAINEAINGNS